MGNVDNFAGNYEESTIYISGSLKLRAYGIHIGPLTESMPRLWIQRKPKTYELPPLQGVFDPDSIYFLRLNSKNYGFMYTKSGGSNPLSQYFTYDLHRRDNYRKEMEMNPPIYKNEYIRLENTGLQIISAVKMDLSEFSDLKRKNITITTNKVFLAFYKYAAGFQDDEADLRNSSPSPKDTYTRWQLYTLSWFYCFPRHLRKWNKVHCDFPESESGLSESIQKKLVHKRGLINTEGKVLIKNLCTMFNRKHSKYLKCLRCKVWDDNISKFEESRAWACKIPSVVKSEKMAFLNNESGFVLPKFYEGLGYERCYCVKVDSLGLERVSGSSTQKKKREKKGEKGETFYYGLIYLKKDEKVDWLIYNHDSKSVYTSLSYESELKIQELRIFGAVELKRILFEEPGNDTRSRFLKLLDILQESKEKFNNHIEWLAFAFCIGKLMLPRKNTGTKEEDESKSYAGLFSSVIRSLHKRRVAHWWDLEKGLQVKWSYKEIRKKSVKALSDYEKKGSKKSISDSGERLSSRSSSSRVSVDSYLRRFRDVIAFGPDSGLFSHCSNSLSSRAASRPQSQSGSSRKATGNKIHTTVRG